MVEEQTVASKDSVGLSIVDHYPIGIELSSSCGGRGEGKRRVDINSLVEAAKIAASIINYRSYKNKS